MQLRFPDTSYEKDDGYESENTSEGYNEESSYSHETGDGETSASSSAETGGDRYRRSADTYDETYDKFIQEHFPNHADGVKDDDDDKEEYKEENDDKEEDTLEARADHQSEDEDEEESESEEKVPEKRSDYERIKAESLKQASKQKAGNCKKIYKKNSVCQICKDPKTGDKSEACSYSSKPKAKKVAFSKHKKFSFKTDPETKAVEGNDHGDYDSNDNDDDEEKPVKTPLPKAQKKPLKRNNNKKKSKTVKPKKVKSESEESDYGAYKLASYYDADYDDQPRSAKLQVAEQPQERNSNENVNTDFEFIEPYKFDNADFSRALSDFKYRDWTKCDKKIKGELTCYYCKDERGFDQEECVYVSGSKPKSSNLKMVKKYRRASNDEKPSTTTPLGRLTPAPFGKLTAQPIGTPLISRPPFTSITQLSPFPFTSNQKYQALPTAKPAHYTLAAPQTSSIEYSDNPSHKKKAIKRMITIKKQYFESDNSPQTETPINYGKQV